MASPRKIKLYINKRRQYNGPLYMVCGNEVSYYSGFLEEWFESKYDAKIFRRKAWELVGEMDSKEEFDPFSDDDAATDEPTS